MTGLPRPGSPTPPPPTTPTESTPPPNDLALAFVQYALGLMLVFALLLSPILGIIFGTAEDSSTEDVVASSVLSLFFLQLTFQVIQGSFPWVVSRRRGSTLREHCRFSFKLPDDIFFGIALAAACFVGSQIATVGVAALVGLEDTNDASNTDILSDNQDSIWIVGVIFLVVIGAPLAEELLFRGVVLRTLEQWFGTIAAVVVSSLLFAIPHWQPGATWQESTVLLSALGAVGLVLAIGAAVTNRLGASIIAHFMFNGLGTIVTLAYN